MKSLDGFGRLLVLDFETTRSSTGLRPVEVGAILVENGIIVDELDCLVNPGCPIDSWSREVHGISDRDVADADPFADVWEILRPMMTNATVLAHNTSFDSAVVRDEMRRHRLTPPLVEWWCTLRLARKLWADQFVSFKLTALARCLDLKVAKAHRAHADAHLALALLCRQISHARSQSLEVEQIRTFALHRSAVCWPFPKQRHCPECRDSSVSGP